jgi:anti-anti-sigma factor
MTIRVGVGSEELTGGEVVWSAGCITVSGEIDSANARVIGRRMVALLIPGSIVVDCREVTFLDAAGLRMFADLGRAAIDVGAVVHLQSSPAVTETIKLCGVQELPGLVLDRDDADGPRTPR